MRYIKTVLVCGVSPYRIYKANVSEFKHEDGSECNGMTDPDKRKIYIDEALNRTQYNETLQHELRHAWWLESGLANFFAGITKLKGAKLEEAEETFIRIDTPACISTMRSAGLLKGKQ
jgi:Zn-dependent peptidase ImmA (M78 family)